MELLIVIVILAVLVYYYSRRVRAARHWTEIHISPAARQEQADRLLAALQDRGVRTEIRHIGGGQVFGGGRQMISIRVHREDVAIARAVMGEMGIGAT